MARLCPVCGKREIKDTQIMCSLCQKKENMRYYMSRNICPHCRKAPIFDGEKSCPECKAKFANNSAEYREANREYSNKLAAKSHRNTYWNRREAGICVTCGKRKALSGISMCAICRQKKADANRRVMIRKGNEIPRSERVAYGLCYFCGEKLDREGHSCTRCFERNMARMKKVDNSNHPWKINVLLHQKRKEERKENDVSV